MAQHHLKPKFLSIRPTMAGIDRLATLAARWGAGFFYSDNLRIAVSNIEQPELDDCLILVTRGSITALEIRELLMEEML